MIIRPAILVVNHHVGGIKFRLASRMPVMIGEMICLPFEGSRFVFNANCITMDWR